MPYTAAIFDGLLPSVFTLGDGKMYGADAYNRPLEQGRDYKIYVKAYTESEVYNLVSNATLPLNIGTQNSLECIGCVL